MAQTIIVRRSIRTLSLACRNDVTQQARRHGSAIDPWTGERVHLATGYPSVR